MNTYTIAFVNQKYLLRVVIPSALNGLVCFEKDSCILMASNELVIHRESRAGATRELHTSKRYSCVLVCVQLNEQTVTHRVNG
jgi:hypothetical protein